MTKNNGTLAVRVYTSQAELPLEGASVAVLQKGRFGRYDLLSIQAAVRSGLIQSVEIPTPAAAAGLTSNTGDVPYALCTIWAEYPGYYMLEVENVQIFPGVETVQNMELIPLEYGQDSLQSPTVQDTPAQDL